jgi:hypothetical protein
MTGRNGAAARLAGLFRPAVEPGEERQIGRRKPVPQFLDLGHVLAAVIGERLLRQPRGDADAHAAGDQLQQRVAARRIEIVEPGLDQLRPVGARGGVQRLDNGRQAQIGFLVFRFRRRPDQRDGLGQVADEIVGIGKQHFVDALGNQRADHRRLDRHDVEIAGDRRDGIAAVRVRCRGDVIDEQLQLGVARRRQDEAVEEFGEGFHSDSSS